MSNEPEVEIEEPEVETGTAEAAVSEEQEYLQEFQKIAEDHLGVKLGPEEEASEEPAEDPDSLEFEFEGAKVPLKKDHLFQLARLGAQSAKREREIAARAKQLEDLAAQLEDVNSIAGGVANFVAQDREGIKSAMIANLISGKPITDGLEEYDLERYLGRTPLPAKRITRQREEELDEADDDEDDDEDDDLEEERPRRKAQKSRPDPQLVGALQGVAKALQTIQARQDALEKIENDRRADEQKRVQREQQQAFRDKVEAAILRTPALAELPRKDAMEMMVAKMQSSGSRDPMLVANYWAKTLGKRDQKVASSAIREQNKVVKKNAAIPAGGTPPTGRVAAAAKAKAAPQTEEELVIQLMGELEALGEGR